MAWFADMRGRISGTRRTSLASMRLRRLGVWISCLMKRMQGCLLGVHEAVFGDDS
jgi:hypothetical protein